MFFFNDIQIFGRELKVRVRIQFAVEIFLEHRVRSRTALLVVVSDLPMVSVCLAVEAISKGKKLIICGALMLILRLRFLLRLFFRGFL
jgi:hypothetical protein